MSLDLRSCAECGRAFAYNGRDVCDKCLDKEDAKYGLVRRYVRDNPGASVIEVAEATKVNEEIVLRMVKEGRLKVNGQIKAGNCERCGKRISSEAKYCDGCFNIINSELRTAIKSDESPPSPMSKGTKSARDSKQMYIRPKQ